MSNASSPVAVPSVGYARILSAQAHKGQAPALVADAIAEAAADYATNAGAKNKIVAVIAACTSTEKGKTRTPAADTAPGLILAAMQWVLAEAEAAGARPSKGVTPEARRPRALAFADAIRARYIAARDAAADKRAQARADAKKEAPAPVQVTEEAPAIDAVADTPEELAQRLAPVAFVDRVAGMLALLDDSQVADLLSAHTASVARIKGAIVAGHVMGEIVTNARKAAPVKRVRPAPVAQAA